MFASIVLMAGLLIGAQPLEHIVDIQVHGNLLTSDADVIRIAGVETGMTVDARTVDDAAARLRGSRKFEQVEVLKRFASIADPTQINDNGKQFGPRFGFAWDPFSDGKTVVRGYTGVYFARTPLLLLAAAVNNWRLPPGGV